MPITPIEATASVIFLIAILHTFSTPVFKTLAHKHPKHSSLLHLLGEVEVAFGFWAILFIILSLALQGKSETLGYLNNQRFTEPLFVFVIMIIAASKPILEVSLQCITQLSRFLPVHPVLSFFFVTLSFTPLLGSLITEPAAMTLAALLLKEHFYSKQISNKLKYATIGTLFVNVSIGGVLTPFAAPPILMVAEKWQWDLAFTLSTFGWRATLAVLINSLLLTVIFKNELKRIQNIQLTKASIPIPILFMHLSLLVGVIVCVHYHFLFLGIFLIFLGLATTYSHHQNQLIIREAFLVALFLSALVVLGGQQTWWLKPIFSHLNADAVYYGAALLTAIIDNAALTYLGSLVEGLSDSFKYALATGAVTGGGLTVIANAPNPAGYSILNKHFDQDYISPLYLFLSALPPTLCAVICFKVL